MKQKLLYSIRLRIAMLVAVMCAVFTGQAWATDVTWDLSKASYSSSSTSAVTWSDTYVPMELTKGKSSTNANNYLGGTNTHTRMYASQVLTWTPASGYSISEIQITLTGSSYTSGFTEGTWTNASASASGSKVTITPTSGTSAVSCVIKSATRVTSVKVSYTTAKTLSSIAVKDHFTTTNYKVGDEFSPAGLTLTATYDDFSTATITSGFTFKIGESALASGDALSSGAKTVTITYSGKTTTETIHVGELTGIEITTAPTKTTYDEGQTFDPTGMVVTATFSDGEESPTVWTEDVTEDCTFDPDTETALETSDTEVTVSYTWGGANQTANQTITVTAGVPYTVTFNAGSGTCGTSSLTEASFAAGVTLPTATIGVTGWSFAGWATASTTNTETEPTLYAAGATYNPTENTTLYAVYKFTESTPFVRATSLSDITSATNIVIAKYSDDKLLTTTFANNVDAPTETDGKITPAANSIFKLTGNNTDGYTLTNGTVTVGATSTDNSTAISNTSSNSTWKVKAHNTSNTFYFENTGKSNLCLEYYSSSWMVYAPKTPSSNSGMSMKVYASITTTVYNSNPAAIVNPTIAFTTAGDKSLYVKDEASYTNAANVTGIAKTPVYTSSDATVATVSEAGLVTALKAGSTTITAKVAKEVGVNSEASASYTVTVKDAKTIAGLKAITSTATVVSFTADLTDAVVTYVKGDHAFIQDASGAVYASCGSSLTVGKKINGAISGSIKAANAIDEITAITLTAATVTEDGVIPSAEVKTAAQLVANKVDLEGKLVQITGATVTASLTSGSASGGKISDDGKTTEINLYAPDSNIDAIKDAEGTFNGYITLYSGSSIRFNIFEQSQITLTKNAPTAQTLTFESDAVELDEETSAYSAFTGQEVSGAKGTVTYSIDSDDDGVVTSISASTGAVVLSGNYGTATIKATAAAANVTEAGVTTPYTATEKTYTVTVYPRYTVTFSANGVETALRQATHGATIDVPEDPSDISGFKFMGWKTSTVSLTDEAPTMADLSSGTVTPENNTTTYYAVYAVQGGTPLVEHESTFTIKQASAPSSPYVSDGSSWTWSNVTFQNDNSARINSSNGSVTFTLPDGGKAVSIEITKTGNAWANAAAVVLKEGSNTLKSFSNANGMKYDFTSTYDHADSYTFTNTTGSNAWVDHITFEYTTGGVTYDNYCTTVPAHVNISSTVGYTTYVATDNVSFPSGATAYIATQVNTNTIHLEEVLAVPTGTAVVVKGDKGVYILGIEDAGACDDVSENLLLASDGTVTGDGVDNGDETAEGTIYALGNKTAGVGFYLVANGVNVPAGKAYLTIGGGSSVKDFLGFSFGDETGVKAIDNGQLTIDSDAVIFNLNGQRMSKMQRGINIVNGKKVLVK